MPGPEHPCLDNRTLLALLQDDLGAEALAQATLHLDACDSCRRRTTDLRQSFPTQLQPASGKAAPSSGANPTVSLRAKPTGPEASEIRRGTAVDRYLMLGVLGEGGMGRVYAAYDPELDRKVALKLLRAKVTRADSLTEGQTRLLREAQAMARLSHPNVVSVYDVGTYQDRVFVAMELVEGSTLKQWLLAQKRSWRDVLRVFLEAGRGLAAAHAAGLVHRDFKPENVLIGNDGRVRVTDFGLARAAGMSGEPFDAVSPDQPTQLSRENGPLVTPLTETGTVMGTPGYMAPEQVSAAPVDARADQFSFCVALHEALLGVRPPTAQRAGPAPDARAPAVAAPSARIPAWLRRAVLKGVSASPADRYPSMEALLRVLEKDPRLALRRNLFSGSMAVLALAAVLSGVWVVRRHDTLCKGGEAKLAGVWDPARKDGIRAAFLHTGKAFAPDAWRSVERLLDGYAAAWVAQHADACLASRVRGDQSEEVFSLRLSCLDRRLGDLRALTDLFLQADVQTVTKAVPAAYALPELSACADVEGLMAPVPPPADARTREAVKDVRGRLDRAQVLFSAGKIKEGLVAVEPLVAQAQVLGYRPLEAEALFLKGFLEAKGGELKAALDNLRKAHWAAQAGRDDEIAARAAAWTVWVLGRMGQRDEAREWASEAEAVLERMGGNPALEALLDKSLATLDAAEGNYADALGRDQKAVALYQKALGPEHPETLIALNNLGADLHDMGEAEASVEKQRLALELGEKSLGPEHPDLVYPLANLAEGLADVGRNDEGSYYARRGLALAQRELGPTHWLTAILQVDLAFNLGMQGHPQEALSQLDQAIPRLRSALGSQDGQVAQALLVLGGVELRAGRPSQAAAAFDEGLAIQQKQLGPNAFDLARGLSGLGQARLATGDAAGAARALERALKLSEGHKDVILGSSADARFALAQALWAGRRERPRALELARQAEADYASLKLRQAEAERTRSWLAAHAGP